jgi:putative restriction endonuclease
MNEREKTVNWSEDELISRFDSISVWKRGGIRAPHKPLLVLLAIGKCFVGQPRMIPYSTIDHQLRELLEEFGRYNDNIRTEYPFWRLQKDGIWELSSTDNVYVSTSGDPRKGDLLKHNIQGGFPEPLFIKLRKNRTLSLDIAKRILEKNFSESLHEDILSSVGIDGGMSTFKRRPRDPNFREKVLTAYEYKCAICGFNVGLAGKHICLEAAHIKWHQAGGPDIEENGMALCVLHHKLFDRGALAITPNMTVAVSDKAHGNFGFDEWLLRYHGKTIQSPQRKIYYPQVEFVEWHVQEVFKGTPRDFYAS